MEPIGDLFKTDVYKLSKFMGIPKEIIEKPPRAGLWNNQTEIAEKLDISVDDVDMIINKVNRNKHKSEVPESPEKTIL